MSHFDGMKILLSQIFDLRKLMRCILIAVVPASLFYIFSLAGFKSVGFHAMEILRDPAQQTGASSFIGFLSNIGVWLWVSSAAICFFTVLTGAHAHIKAYNELILLAGILSTILAIDDFFLIHDRYINEKICYLVYAISAGALLIRHYKQIIEVDGFSFFLAGSFLALSIAIDVIQSHIPFPYNYTQIVEEGFKFIGAATWLYFISRAASFHTTSPLPPVFPA